MVRTWSQSHKDAQNAVSISVRVVNVLRPNSPFLIYFALISHIWSFCMCICVSRYLQTGAHSPLCLPPSEGPVQGNVTQLSASSRSWTLGGGAPEGASSWLGWWSSSRHSGTLQRKERERRVGWRETGPLVHEDFLGFHIVKSLCSFVIEMDLVMLLSSPRYSNSSFSAMPLWEKHCWQIRAYL